MKNNTLLNQEKEKQNRPQVTIITVVFNGQQFLEATIQSVINQSYDNVEYIIIDGGSTDGTIDIIKKYDKYIDYWVSEQDKGVYDAMNKGVLVASGEWINFMNAGDIFNSTDILEKVFDRVGYVEEILYGDVKIRYPDFFRIQRSGSHTDLWKGMQFCHQSIFVRSAIHKLKLFDTANLIAADFQFYYELNANNAKFKYIDFVIASVIADGISNKNRIKTINAWRDTVCANNCSWQVKLYYKLLKINETARSLFKQILPKRITDIIILNKK